MKSGFPGAPRRKFLRRGRVCVLGGAAGGASVLPGQVRADYAS